MYPANRNRFLSLLSEYKVKAYIVGHTHNYSAVKINKLWHVDVGHVRGLGDKGARSTYMIMNVNRDQIAYKTYRLNFETNKYDLADEGLLD